MPVVLLRVPRTAALQPDAWMVCRVRHVRDGFRGQRVDVMDPVDSVILVATDRVLSERSVPGNAAGQAGADAESPSNSDERFVT